MPQFQTLPGLQTLDSGEQMSTCPTCHADPCRPGLHLTLFQGSRQWRSQILQWLIAGQVPKDAKGEQNRLRMTQNRLQ